jgi:hypothetical protein
MTKQTADLRNLAKALKNTELMYRNVCGIYRMCTVRYISNVYCTVYIQCVLYGIYPMCTVRYISNVYCTVYIECVLYGIYPMCTVRYISNVYCTVHIQLHYTPVTRPYSICRPYDVVNERVEGLKYLGTNLTNQNSIQEEVKSRLKSDNACYYSVHNLLSSRLLSKNLKIRI